jgi:hypothetical protein
MSSAWKTSPTAEFKKIKKRTVSGKFIHPGKAYRNFRANFPGQSWHNLQAAFRTRKRLRKIAELSRWKNRR